MIFESCVFWGKIWMNMASDDQIIHQLDVVLQRAFRAKKDRVFFRSVYDYIETFDEHSELVPVNRKILSIAQKELHPINKLEAKAQNEIVKVLHCVDDYIKCKVANNNVVDHLQKARDAYDETLISSLGKTKEMYADLTYALMLLVEIGEKKHIEFCKQFGEIDKQDRIQGWRKLSPAYNHWEEGFRRVV